MGDHMTTHEIVNPDALAPPIGFTHAVIAAPGRTVYLGGQAGVDASGDLASTDLVEQFNVAASNVVTALEATGAKPDHLVSIQIFVTSAEEYRSSLEEVGEVYRRNFGSHYPALGLFEVSGLFDPGAKVELWCVAVVPEAQR